MKIRVTCSFEPRLKETRSQLRQLRGSAIVEVQDLAHINKANLDFIL